MALEQAAARWGIRLQEEGPARQGHGKVIGHEVILAQPLVWMNQHGPVVRRLLAERALSPSDLIVIHDDLDLPVGRLRLKRTGGSGGHNGIRSLLEALSGAEFCRIKIGIGRPAPGEEAAEYVLAPFERDDLEVVHEVLLRTVDALECLVQHGIDTAMNRYNIRETGRIE